MSTPNIERKGGRTKISVANQSATFEAEARDGNVHVTLEFGKLRISAVIPPGDVDKIALGLINAADACGEP